MKQKIKIFFSQRPRRNRRSESLRSLVRETRLSAKNLVYPLFVIEGKGRRQAVVSMPGIYKFSVDLLCKEARVVYQSGIPAVAIFPVIRENLKDKRATQSVNPNGLLQRTILALKTEVPGLVVITDVAMDPYSSDGHDGLVKGKKVLNDETLPILADMAVSQAMAGSDVVAPSDMMDGRVGYIRRALDDAGFTNVGILAYSAKYASSFYGPFRDALGSSPRMGDKKTYQMDPANVREAVREAKLDIDEGADIVMVKPALAYLDVIRAVRNTVEVPVAAYNVSGEYAMIKAAAQHGWINERDAVLEMLIAIKRAGADIIFTYFAKNIVKSL